MDWNEWLDKCPVGYLLMTMDRETITYRFDVPDDDLDEQLKEEGVQDERV